MPAFTSPRGFRIWDYPLSQQYLLLRSERIGQLQNIDLLFAEVFYLEVPFGFTGLEITAPTVADLDHLATRCPEQPPEARYYVLISQGQRYYVGAAELTIEANDLQFWERPAALQRAGASAEA